MKLKKIKLSGFKSFVDFTSIELQSNLTAIVGPNGCGKSNIIDAIRWVLGEISAKQLRGDSMSDVIFSGSSARNRVGKASVELIFDNGEIVFGGEYASYSEISIKREISRDGFSDYFINGSSCRRRDITDLFLGTGLGHGNYAVIEQGTISQFIEAKPEEVRIFIEEASGISKYKERRRDTENRIKQTRENLIRFNDILIEIDKQLKVLKSQARAAEYYKKLKDRERLVRAELIVLHMRDLHGKLLIHRSAIEDQELLLEKNINESKVFDAKIATLNNQYAMDVEKFNEVQSEYYSLGNDIGRREQQIKHIKNRGEELAKDLEESHSSYQATLVHRKSDQEQIDLLVTQKLQQAEKITALQRVVTQTQEELEKIELDEERWRKSWDTIISTISQADKTFELEQTNLRHLEQMLEGEQRELDKVEKELMGIDISVVNSELLTLSNTLVEFEAKRKRLREEVEAKQQQIIHKRSELDKLVMELDSNKNNLQILKGRQASLEALQQAALGKNNSILAEWLRANHLMENRRLAQEIAVADGWDTAVEIVLGAYLDAICMDDIKNIRHAVSELSNSSLTICDHSVAPMTFSNSRLSLATLASKINSKLAVENLLHGVYTVATLEEALDMRNMLCSGESMVTKDGVWIGQNWLRLAPIADPKLGIFQRERELTALQTTIAREQDSCIAGEQNINGHRHVLTVLEEEHRSLQNELNDADVSYGGLQNRIAAQKVYLEHLGTRITLATDDRERRKDNLEKLQIQRKEILEKCDLARIARQNSNASKEDLLYHRDEIQGKLRAKQRAMKENSEALATLIAQTKLIETQVEYLTRNLDRFTQNLVALKEREEKLRGLIITNVEPLEQLETGLGEKLARRVDVESNLTAMKQKLSQLEQEQGELNRRQMVQRETNATIREGLEKVRTEHQVVEVRYTVHGEQLRELNFEFTAVSESLDEMISCEEKEQQLSKVTTKIAKLGPINLAAIDELEKLEERKKYLDGQNQDLLDALGNLEDAIRKIDSDTKEKFKNAYDAINEKFQEIFPRIFNGGRAYLEKTADNLLETGIMIMAEPPGKRNASIHLLSGGEKALTAISLIFAIFHLTPAPFCILDEVDAPLDDLNVVRFRNLVKEMAKSIQFIFITHNKLTMEIANQLIGVTMQEPGVSRTVAVDINAAISLADGKKTGT